MSDLRRTVGVLAVAVLVAAGCVQAGIWQWGRHQDRSLAASLLETNYDAAPVPLADLMTDGLAPDEVWRPVVAVGHYLPDAGVLLRGRPVAGQPAVHALELLAVDTGPLTGSLLVVNRGWVGVTADQGLPDVADPPSGTAQVVVRLRPSEPPSNRSTPDGQVRSIAVEDVRRVAGPAAQVLAEAEPTVLPAYGVLVSEDGRPAEALEPQPRPEVTLGVNLSYAFQWWVFAVGALVGGVLLVRRPPEPTPNGGPRRPGTTGHPAGAAGTPNAPGSAPRTRRRPTAEEEEDALLDAQTGAEH